MCFGFWKSYVGKNPLADALRWRYQHWSESILPLIHSYLIRQDNAIDYVDLGFGAEDESQR